ncbi:MAG: alanine--tRNA ligase [Bacillota bacterium]|jgi:alanyl-tRNA synthetase
MERLGGSEIRTRFLEYFRSKGHEVVASSPVVPAGDPTLLFTNAGMNQFKDVFLGLESRPYRRAATAQKCVRAGGKHNDLDQVGRTARHHTFFEMLGNFSFGDYFKVEAIRFAWDLLTRGFGLDPDRLTATIYRDDDEAYAIWREKIGLGPERVVRLGEKDNFWSMGDTGPCGPCSEIVYDRGPEYACADGPECAVGRCDCDRWLELWNLVFMQYDRDSGGTMRPLPKPCVDTGMGLERIASVLQDVPSNFETDLLRPYIGYLEDRTGRPYRRGPEGFPFRVIADHIRSCVFIIADGVLPSNEGRGYVLRRILRRAARFGRVLGFDRPFLHDLVPLVTSIMGEAYPELIDKEDHVRRVIEAEEARFLETLTEGTRRAEELLAAAAAAPGGPGGDGRGKVLPGRDAFLLYDTFGFPIDLTEDMAAERGLTVDREGFERAMEEQRRRAREARETAGVPGDEAAALVELFAGKPSNLFVGYDNLEVRVTILALAGGGRLVGEAVPEDGEIHVLLTEVPFYPESGGQVSDTGSVEGRLGRAEVLRSFRLPDGKIVVTARVLEGRLVPGETVEAVVDRAARSATARSHTATHLLHHALRTVLGEHAAQAGSLVAPDRLRFDYSHFGSPSREELERVEDLVNQAVMACRSVRAAVRPYREAVSAGAIALFGEKYGDEVRVVEIDGISRELCGGTHVSFTGEVGQFRILSESGIGAGLRRVEAVTGLGALERARRTEAALGETAAVLHCDPEEVPERARRLTEQIRRQEKEMERQTARAAQESAQALVDGAETAGPYRFVVGLLPPMSMENLRQAGDHVRDRLGPGGVVLLASPTEDGERVSLVAMAAKALVDKGIHVGKIIGDVARVAGGGGGGRPDMAQAGGRDPARLPEALDRGRVLLRKALEEIGGGGQNTST